MQRPEASKASGLFRHAKRQDLLAKPLNAVILTFQSENLEAMERPDASCVSDLSDHRWSIFHDVESLCDSTSLKILSFS
ncbi:hypothetical protein [Beijerinckia mobilis]|uniref:hypothetical protein n=1 Tax=Beijerinckia mobilis TaxID=231434 RepID=UPI0005531FCD|nr:hypothetical protein [Beijerinckia mobilis]